MATPRETSPRTDLAVRTPGANPEELLSFAEVPQFGLLNLFVPRPDSWMRPPDFGNPRDILSFVEAPVANQTPGAVNADYASGYGRECQSSLAAQAGTPQQEPHLARDPSSLRPHSAAPVPLVPEHRSTPPCRRRRDASSTRQRRRRARRVIRRSRTSVSGGSEA
ncbi:hypothetical protein DL769_001640 [Monosporascus sp. CRB-8-3]|nr:hypothetical protein DL769_001640 [Monosporascus sp. CRB-8-3]